ncbi:phospholipase [Schizosaccharomyces cryophilus OY26]|uniref:Phospholipase n=1 Tax=Schizosaccharomyces cryophilus (strain OY26 / ATCC MYA-4695 / CBS 11777 / NBRC 106824 / NRRL Y48691) TaxID=653667 RepID=S9VZM7_SCHCR|nr:phospholipase [Schizosaccharomyces cryophilus OY26]EPY51679.1 phospholipase [Schizosaccharomyces cryophilus OY26]
MSFLTDCLPSNAHGQVIPAKEQTYNVVIMMHGLGDSEQSFAQAARNIPLPNTSYISLRGVYRLPLDFGTPEGNWMWGEDVHFDMKGDLESEADFSKCLSVLRELIRRIVDRGILSTRIFFFSFGQGGMAALYCVSQLASTYQFGGVFSFGGKLPLAMTLPSSPFPISVYLFEKRKNSSLDDYEESRLKRTFRSVQRICWNRDEKTDMPSSPREWYVFIETISKKLYVHNRLYEDAIQLS